MYAAIDLVTDKLERQIRKNKTRLNNKFKNIIQFDINTDTEVEEDNLNIIKRKKYRNIINLVFYTLFKRI